MNEASPPLCLWILEDDAEARSVMVDISRSAGFNILEMGSIAELSLAFDTAIRLNVAPSGVIASLKLKDGTSDRFLMDCRKVFPSMSVFCISSDLNPETNRLRRMGIEILVKPVGLKAFLQVLSKTSLSSYGE